MIEDINRRWIQLLISGYELRLNALIKAGERYNEYRYNPNHDPITGRFTSSFNSGLTNANGTDIIKLETKNGIKVKQYSKHMLERARERGVNSEQITDALRNPLYIDDVKIDKIGRKSQRFIGSFATVNINPETGIISTVWKTGKKKLRKYHTKNI